MTLFWEMIPANCCWLSLSLFFPLPTRLAPNHAHQTWNLCCGHFIFKMEETYLSHWLIKKKIIVWLIYRKSGKNRYKLTVRGLLTKYETPRPHKQPAKWSTHNNSNPQRLYNTTEPRSSTPQQKAIGNTKTTVMTKSMRTSHETEDHPSSIRERLSYDATLLAFAHEWLLLQNAGPRAIAHLIVLVPDCRSRQEASNCPSQSRARNLQVV